MMVNERNAALLALSACAAAMLVTTTDAPAQRYPDRPLRLIVPFAPGSAPDNVARIVAPQITAISGQPVIVDTRPGAAGTIATDLAAKAPPDGYTIMLAVLGPTALAPTLYPKLPYDPVKDFAPVTLLAFCPEIVLMSPSGFNSVKELMALARAKPGEVSYASAGSGTLPHLSAELFATRAKVRLLHVPYKSAALSLADLMGSRVSFAFANLGTALPHVKAGKLTGLAVTGGARTNLLPELPTVAEAAGLPGFEMND
jgi:tripartite-type tricarboxylate transporter receptor subunit TctC